MPPTHCPACDAPGPFSFLGGLGRKLWHRCRACGVDFHWTPDEED